MAKKKKKLSLHRIQKRNTKRRIAKQKKRKSLLKHRKFQSSGIGLGPKPPREISPAANLNVDQVISMLIKNNNAFSLDAIKKTRIEKAEGTRPIPSSRLIGDANDPSPEFQKKLLDRIAHLVDENLFGRSEMCMQFASLLALALQHCGYDAKAYQGKARYKKPDGSWFEWNHAWVLYYDIVVDGNADSIFENPMVNDNIDPAPFWGKIISLSSDRHFDFNESVLIKADKDTKRIWWPELLKWLNTENQTNDFK